MLLRTKPVHITLGLVLLASACQIEQLPADEDESGTNSYWDQAEVDAACQDWAETLDACASGEENVDALADSCRESVLIDNANEDAGCHAALVESYACVGGLSCEQLTAYSDRTDDYPCQAESELVGQRC